MLLVAAFFWGSGNVSQKLVLDEIGPLTAVGLRCLIGAVVILPFVLRELRPGIQAGRLAIRGMLVVATLFAGAITLQQVSYAATTVTNASFLINMTTVVTPLVVWALLKTRPTTAIWAAVAAAFAGALLMSGGSLSTIASGDLGCLLAAVLYSVWFVKLGKVVCDSGRPVLVTMVQFLLTGGTCLAIGFASETVSVDRLTAALPNLLVLGVFATGLAYGLQAIAQQYATASTAAVLTSAESVFGAGAAALLLGERFTPLMLLGAALILIAILTVQLAPTATPRLAVGG